MLETNLDDLALIIRYFKNNKVVALPTDTIYGLSCRVTASAAIKKIYRLKKRDLQKTPIVLVGSWCMLKKYCYVSVGQDKYLRSIWLAGAQPTTVILRARDILPKGLMAADGSVAVRLPSAVFLAKIIKLLGEPIISTSLNLSQQKNLITLKNLDKYFTDEKPDLVVEAGVIKAQASKIIDIRDLKNIKIIRK